MGLRETVLQRAGALTEGSVWIPFHQLVRGFYLFGLVPAIRMSLLFRAELRRSQVVVRRSASHGRFFSAFFSDLDISLVFPTAPGPAEQVAARSFHRRWKSWVPSLGELEINSRSELREFKELGEEIGHIDDYLRDLRKLSWLEASWREAAPGYHRKKSERAIQRILDRYVPGRQFRAAGNVLLLREATERWIKTEFAELLPSFAVREDFTVFNPALGFSISTRNDLGSEPVMVLPRDCAALLLALQPGADVELARLGIRSPEVGELRRKLSRAEKLRFTGYVRAQSSEQTWQSRWLEQLGRGERIRVLPIGVPFEALLARNQSLVEWARNEGLSDEDLKRELKEYLARFPWQTSPLLLREGDGRTFASLPRPSEAVSKRRLRVCLVTSDLLGLDYSGGVGTAYAALAEVLAEGGHAVTLLYTSGLDSPRVANQFAKQRERYAEFGVELLCLPEPTVPIEGSSRASASYRVFHWLREREWDLVHVPEMEGLSYFALRAKRQGLAFGSTRFCVGMHGPSAWHRHEDERLPETVDDIEVDYLERESVSMADVVITPSQYMANWAQSHGWHLPLRTYVQQNLIPRAARAPVLSQKQPLEELVFFGRLESRKGLDFFCDALERLPGELLAGKKVVFLGPKGKVRNISSDKYLETRLADASFGWELLSDLDQPAATRYLSSGGKLAVIPSRAESMGFTVLECLCLDLPFIASRSSAFAEIVHRDDQEEVLFDRELRQFVEKLTEVLSGSSSELPHGRPSLDPWENERTWLDWHSGLEPGVIRERPRSIPLVTICVAHRNRPALLARALQSLRAQTYRHFELILVDDCSDLPEAKQALQELEEEWRSLGWRVLRQTEQRGPRAARNLAALHARGEFLLFVDDDNVADPKELETLVHAALCSGAHTVCSPFRRLFVNEPGRESLWLPVGGDPMLGLLQNTFGDMNSLVRRDVFFACGGLREAGQLGCEDWEFFSTAALKGFRHEVVPQPLYTYHDQPKSFSKVMPWFASHYSSLHPYLSALPASLRSVCLLARGLLGAVRENAQLVGEDRTTRFRNSRLKRFPNVLFRADVDSAFSGVELLEGAVMTVGENFLEIDAKSDDPCLLLPPLPYPLGKRILVTVSIIAPVVTTVGLYYLEAEAQSYSEERALSRDLMIGKNTVCFTLEADLLNGRLRLDPGSVPRRLLIDLIEIRSE